MLSDEGAGGYVVDPVPTPSATEIAICMRDVNWTSCHHWLGPTGAAKSSAAHQCTTADIPSST